MIFPLTSQELTQERTPIELRDWIDGKIREFSKSREWKEEALLMQGLAKLFFEEVLPLSQLAMNLYGNRPDVTCIPNLDYDNYDARFVDKSQSPPTELKVEFTRAIDGHDDHLRMKYFLEHGHVNLGGTLQYEGSEKIGHKIEVQNEMVNVDDTRGKTRDLIKKCAKGKSNRKYGKSYLLVITFDDLLGFRFDDSETSTVLNELLKETLSESNLDFEKVCLLGFSGKTLLMAPGNLA